MINEKDACPNSIENPAMISEIGLRYGRYLPESVKSKLYPLYYYIRDIERYLAYKYRKDSGDEIIETEYGFRMSIDKSDFVQRRYVTKEAKSEEKLIKFLLREMDRTSGDFLDIGANVGFYSLLFVSNSQGSVFAFEPLSYNINKLKQNLKLNGFDSVTVFPIGLSNRTGTSEICYYPFNKGAASGSTSEGLRILQKSEVVKFDRLDKVENLSDNIGLVKIDVEGYELDVLEGSEDTIRTQNPKLFIELHPEELEMKGQSVLELVEWIFNVGYNTIYLIQDEAKLEYREAKRSIKRIESNHGIYCRYN